jgi:hypothetical protein
VVAQVTLQTNKYSFAIGSIVTAVIVGIGEHDCDDKSKKVQVRVSLGEVATRGRDLYFFYKSRSHPTTPAYRDSEW